VLRWSSGRLHNGAAVTVRYPRRAARCDALAAEIALSALPRPEAWRKRVSLPQLVSIAVSMDFRLCFVSVHAVRPRCVRTVSEYANHVALP
jgi:hypothetical protein